MLASASNYKTSNDTPFPLRDRKERKGGEQKSSEGRR